MPSETQSTVTYTAAIKLLTPLEGLAPKTIVSEFELKEGYNTGWTANVIVSFQFTESYAYTGGIVAKASEAGLNAGVAVILELAPNVGDASRTWPAIIDQFSPIEPEGLTQVGSCNLRLVDPVTYLSNFHIWGAYRACSVGNMIGGALSMATSDGDGKPTLKPVLKGLPAIQIVEDFDTATSSFLKQIPYSIATGQTLGQWLGDIVNELALRVELVSNEDNSVNVVLSDQLPSGTPLSMATLSATVPDGSNEALAGRLFVAAVVGHAGTKKRDAVLDSIGTIRRFGTLGNIGRTLSGPDISLDEAARRVDKSLIGVYTEMLQVLAITRQPGLRPGRLIDVALQESITVRRWQVSEVHHFYTPTAYDNEAKLIRGDSAWHPAPPKIRSPVFVGGVLDSGRGYRARKPVARDTVGRIFVRFPFSPFDATSLTAAEREIRSVADTNLDGLLSLNDFTAAEKKDFIDSKDKWEKELEKYENDEYGTQAEYETYEKVNKTYRIAQEEKSPSGDIGVDYEMEKKLDEIVEKGTAEDEQYVQTTSVTQFVNMLTTEAERNKWYKIHPLRNQRKSVLKYKAYKEASTFDSADTDRDRYFSDRDDLISNDLGLVLKNETKRESLVNRWEDIKESEEEEETRTDEELETRKKALNEVIDNEASTQKQKNTAYKELEGILAREYGVLFDDDYSSYFDDADSDKIAAKKDAELEPQRWPPRIPLTVIEPMAGKGHGFITSHRQGNTCRVAVYNPLWAEIIGFQYRDTQRINPYIIEAAAGMVVEHNSGANWSGVVFTRIDSERDTELSN